MVLVSLLLLVFVFILRVCFVCLFVFTHFSFHEAEQVKSLYINILKQWNMLKISLLFKEFTNLKDE